MQLRDVKNLIWRPAPTYNGENIEIIRFNAYSNKIIIYARRTLYKDGKVFDFRQFAHEYNKSTTSVHQAIKSALYHVRTF